MQNQLVLSSTIQSYGAEMRATADTHCLDDALH